MNIAEETKQAYFRQTLELLRDYPQELRTFEELWAGGRVREAYISVTKAVEKLHLTRSPENLKADEDFFWVHMH
jgi:hypothetical protein